ncbi:MAG: hypothetical protein WC996_09205 [Peptostreptococcales bacterium]
MGKYIFDTNCFYQIKFEHLDKLNLDNNKYFVSLAQYIELKNKKIDASFSKERKERVLKTFFILDKEKLPSESFFLGDLVAGVLGNSKLGTRDIYQDFKKELDNKKLEKNNHIDSLLVEIAVSNEIIFVTNEKKIISIMTKYYPSLIISLSEFKKMYLK